MSNPDYHRRQAAIFKRLSETAQHPDTAAALLWLAEEHRAQGEFEQESTRPAPKPTSGFSVTKAAKLSIVRATSRAFWQAEPAAASKVVL